jgi:hypothetical protein
MTGWRSEWRALPPLARFGAITIGVGGLADTLAHLQGPAISGGFTPAQQLGHLVILLGMVATLTGVLLDALWPASRRRQTPTITHKGGSHANR